MSHIACLQLMATELRVENDLLTKLQSAEIFQRIQRGFPRPGGSSSSCSLEMMSAFPSRNRVANLPGSGRWP